MSDGIDTQINLKTLFDTWPAVIPVFVRHRMICVGCTMSAFDTLGEAVANYHLEWPAFRSELCAAIQGGCQPGTASPA